MNLEALILLVLKISIVLSVFALGLKATFADATYFFRHPIEMGRAFLSMNVLMPLLAVVLALAFNLHPAVKIALVALSVSPVPPFFPKKAVKVGGKDDYSVGLLVATAVLAIVVIPFSMEIFERIGSVPLQMSAGSVATLVFTTVLAPLLVGIALRAIAPTLAERAAKPIGILATVLLVLSVLPVFFDSIHTILSLIGDGTLLSFAGFALIGYLLGQLLGGPEPENRRVLALATASRHPAIAVAIAHANFPQQKLAVPAIVLYLIVSGIVTGLASKLNKAGSTPTESEKRIAA
jgi:bile acid:Na+ symporter, BASS family